MEEFGSSADCDGGLLRGERLVLRTVRLLALEVRCRGLKAQFEHACGCSGAEAYCGIAAFVAQLRLMGRRGISLGAPFSNLVTGDEVLILQAFACAQADDYPGLNARLAALVGSPAPMTLGAAACLAAQILAMNGLMLRVQPSEGREPARCPARPDVRSNDNSVAQTVH